MVKFDVVGIGNALLDVIVRVDDKILENFGLQKSVMHLVNTNESQYILENLNDKDTTLVSGGSIANSLVGLSSLGDSTAFIGSVGIDQFADMFDRDLEMYGVMPYISRNGKYATGHAITFITPDGERTFATHVGAAAYLTSNNINANLVRSASILYIEGYVLAHEQACEAAKHAASIAKEHKVLIAIDMSNVSMVREHGEHLKEFIEEYADVVFANEDEARAYTGRDPFEALEILSEICKTSIVTLNDKGSLIKESDKVFEIDPVEANMVSANGAGDMYAAGILHGIVNKISLEEAGKIASFFAAKAVEIDEARLPLGYVQEQLKKEFKTGKKET